MPRRWVAVDLDEIAAPILGDVVQWFGRYSAAYWATHSSTPEAPRLRVIIELGDTASRDQCIAIGKLMEHQLSDEFGDRLFLDASTFRPEQPVFLPPTGAVIQRFNGVALAVPSMATLTAPVTPPTEEAQKTSEVMLSSSVLLLSSSVGVGCWTVPADTLPTEVGHRNASLFRLARCVKAKFPDATNAELRAIALQWHRLAMPVIGTIEFSVTLTDFLRGIEKVKQPFGTVMQDVLSGIDEDAALPAGLEELAYGRAGNRLVRICAALQEREGDGPFFLSARQAGSLVGVHFTDASKMLSTFVFDGVLELVTRGVGKAASRYRFVWPVALGAPA